MQEAQWKIVSIDVNEDSQAVERCLDRQARAGLQEATFAPITSSRPGAR